MSCPAEVGETVGSVGSVKVVERIVGGAEAFEKAVGGVEMDFDVVEVVPAGADEPDCE